MREGGGEGGMQRKECRPAGPPRGSSHRFVLIHGSSAQRRGVSLFEARNLVILGAKTAGMPSPPILFFLPFEVTAHWELSGSV